MFRIPNFEIIQFTDPLCNWCWGSEPLLRKLETRFPKKIKISYVMGGLIENIKNYRDDINNIGGNIQSTNKNLARLWTEAAAIHKMPTCVEGMRLFSDKYNSTYPSCIAYHAAKIQSEKLANKYLRRIQEATMTESSQTTNPKILVELAKNVGLRIGDFIQAFENGIAERRFQEDLLYTKANKISTFPSYLIRNNYNGKSLILRGNQKYEDVYNVLKYLTDEELTEVYKDNSLESLLHYLQSEVKSTPIEIQAIFNYSDEELMDKLKQLKNKHYITCEETGETTFVYYLGKEIKCDPITGICEV